MPDVFHATSLGTKYVLDASALGPTRDALRRGGLVVYPTDTVYGVAVDPFQNEAVDKLYAAKGRPRNLPVSLAVADVADVFRLGTKTPLAESFCSKNLPGPFTVVLLATPEAPRAVVSADGRLGLRVPNHPIPRLLAKACGPLTATSANVHGKPAPGTCEEARRQLGDRVDIYIDGGPTPLGRESTIVDLTGPRAKVLRQGGVPKGL